MMYSRAQVIRIRADAVGFQCITFWGCIAGSGASFSCNVFNLVTGHSFVEVGDVSEEFNDLLRGHSDVYEEGGQGESAYV